MGGWRLNKRLATDVVGRLSSAWRISFPCRKNEKSWRHLSSATGDGGLKVFVVAGEPSGDAIASRLMASLRLLSPKPITFAGVGGPLMEKEGMKSDFSIDEIAVMGLLELLPHLIRIWVRLRQTVAAALKFQPHIVITVDAKGFCFRVLHGIASGYAKQGKQRPLFVHYVAPSFWAWKGGDEKLKNLVNVIDHLLCTLPFEEAACKARGLPATFVGNPVLDDAHVVASTSMSPRIEKWWIGGDGLSFREQHGIYRETILVSVLPGSRLQEVRRMLPIFKDALRLLSVSFPSLAVVIPTVSSQIVTGHIEAQLADWSIPVVLLPGATEREKYSAFSASNAALCTSGTAVLQLLMAQVPMVVAYRAHPLTEWFIQARTKLHVISLPNILLGSAVIPEALFTACTPQQLNHYLSLVLSTKSLQTRQADAAEKVLEMLASPVCSQSWSNSSLDHNVDQRKSSFVAASTILSLFGKSIK